MAGAKHQRLEPRHATATRRLMMLQKVKNVARTMGHHVNIYPNAVALVPGAIAGQPPTAATPQAQTLVGRGAQSFTRGRKVMLKKAGDV